MSVYYDILSKVKSMIVDYGPLSASGGIPAIPTTNVIFQKLPLTKDGIDQWKANCVTPGIIVGFSGTVVSDPTEGSNSHDVVKYPVVIVGIDRDFSVFDDERIQVWLNRAEAIRQLFHMQNLRAEVSDVTLSWMQPQEVFEERYGYLYDYSVFVFPLIAKSEESRNAQGLG
jgi:hypothetical protein